MVGKADKGGFLSPKQVANRIKAKGLQKLRWYCQMCQKQCRDENGFKCHCMSESHQRQMAMFSENAGAYMDEFSREFESGMMEIIARKARGQRVSANQIYKEYISFKQHFHMNATVWETLTDFVMYLGREGKCEVDETEKGWFVTYIDRDPEKLRALEAKAKRERYEMDSEEKYLKEVERLNKIAKGDGIGEPPQATELQRDEGAPALTFTGITASKSKFKDLAKAACSGARAVFGNSSPTTVSEDGEGASEVDGGGDAWGGKTKMSNVQQLMQQQEKRKDAAARTDYWLASGIIVKVMNKSLADGEYYKQKGTIEKLVDKYTAHVRIHRSGQLLMLDQDELETVIPQVGGKVLVLNGAYRGAEAKLLSINVEQFSTQVCLLTGAHHGRILDGLEYEDVCKLSGT